MRTYGVFLLRAERAYRKSARYLEPIGDLVVKVAVLIAGTTIVCGGLSVLVDGQHILTTYFGRIIVPVFYIFLTCGVGVLWLSFCTTVESAVRSYRMARRWDHSFPLQRIAEDAAQAGIGSVYNQAGVANAVHVAPVMPGPLWFFFDMLTMTGRRHPDRSSNFLSYLDELRAYLKEVETNRSELVGKAMLERQAESQSNEQPTPLLDVHQERPGRFG
jgi:hypothetical protein